MPTYGGSNVYILSYTPDRVNSYKMPDGIITDRGTLYAQVQHGKTDFSHSYQIARWGSGDRDTLKDIGTHDMIVVYQRYKGTGGWGRWRDTYLAYRPILPSEFNRVFARYNRELRAFAIYRRVM